MNRQNLFWTHWELLPIRSICQHDSVLFFSFFFRVLQALSCVWVPHPGEMWAWRNPRDEPQEPSPAPSGLWTGIPNPQGPCRPRSWLPLPRSRTDVEQNVTFGERSSTCWALAAADGFGGSQKITNPPLPFSQGLSGTGGGKGKEGEKGRKGGKGRGEKKMEPMTRSISKSQKPLSLSPERCKRVAEFVIPPKNTFIGGL